MIRIAILDDSDKDRTFIGNIINKYFKHKEIRVEIHTFLKAEILLIELREKEYYDIPPALRRNLRRGGVKCGGPAAAVNWERRETCL